MCDFYSVVSDGKGNVKHFTPEYIINEMVTGNKNNYDWNSHTSLMHSLGIPAKAEDKYNKWEYDPDKKTIKKDSLVTTDDRDKVKKYLDDYFSDKDIVFLRNLFGRNAGSYNAGSRNAGYGNAGYGNAGSYNAGSRNAGYGNAGSDNAGSYNAGSYNAGSYNAGSDNAGSDNAGYGNAGSDNAGSYNAGSRNAGYGNAGYGNAGSFCTTSDLRLFDKPCTLEEHEKVKQLDWSWFISTRWISASDMTKAEKEAHPYWETTKGYVHHIPYAEIWDKCPKEFIKDVKKLKNFDKKVFFKITGLNV